MTAGRVGLRLLRNRRYAMLVLSRLFASMGEAVAVVAVPLLVLKETGSGLALGLVSGLSDLAHLAAFLPIGALVDRWDCRRIMVSASLVRAFFAALTPIGFLAGIPPIWPLILGAVPISVFDTFYVAASPASIPSIVEPEDVPPATSYFQAISTLGYIITVGLAGLFAAALGPALTLLLEAAAFALSGAALMLVRRPFRPAREEPPLPMARAIRQGVAFVWKQGQLRRVMVFTGLMELLVAPLILALSVYITLDLGRSDALFGFVIASYGTGLVIGFVVSAQLPSRNVEARMCAGFALSGLALIAGPTGDMPSLILGAGLLSGVGTAFALAQGIVLRTLRTPEPLLGRVASIGESLHLVLSPLGVVAGGFLVDDVTGASMLAGIGGVRVVICVAFAAWVISARADRTRRA